MLVNFDFYDMFLVLHEGSPMKPPPSPPPSTPVPGTMQPGMLSSMLPGPGAMRQKLGIICVQFVLLLFTMIES